MLAFQVRGWELIVADTSDALIATLGSRVNQAVPIGEGRFSLELPLDTSPGRLLAELTAAGARLVSLNPIRDTLEDLFVQRVREGT